VSLGLVGNIVGELPIQVHSPKGVCSKCSQTSRECMGMETSPYVNNSLFISLLLSHFVKKKYFHGSMGTYKIGGSPPA
jgi:hypothetical protein